MSYRRSSAFLRGFLAFVISLPALAAIDGTVQNATSGKPASGVTVSLVQPGQDGMKTIGRTTTDAAGKFLFPQAPRGPGLIQANYQGVNYNKMLMPGAPTTGVQVDIFDSTRKPVSQVAQHMILIQPTGSELNIAETYIFQGDPKLTYNDQDNGTVRFYVPGELKGEIKVQATGPGGMPVQRPAEKTKTPNVYKIDYPIKPGETRLDLSYTVPESNPAVLSGRILHKEGKTRLVVPNGVSLKGDGITDLGKEPQSQASIYDLAGDTYKVEIAGVGELQAPEASTGEDNGEPQIAQVQPHVYNQLYWLTGIIFAILGLGSFLLAKR